jgi:acyl-CoA synthetase (AMP-forming)/AMP-acid ligase II
VIHTHSLGRALRYYPDAPALISSDRPVSFRELHARVASIAATLQGEGFAAGDRLALLLPNGNDYLELVYACAWIGVTAVPLNIRLSTIEIDQVLSDASPRGLIRHSSFPAPSKPLTWQRVLDEKPFGGRTEVCPDPLYDPEAVLVLIYTSGTTGRAKGVVLTHAAILASIDHFNYWMPYEERGVYLHAAPIFHIADFPFVFAAPAFGTCQVTIPKFTPGAFCEAVQRDRVTRTVLVPTMLNLLTQFAEFQHYDLGSLGALGYGGSPIAPELVHRTRQVLPQVKLAQVYGLSETGFLTGLKDEEHTEPRLLSCGRTCPGIDMRVVDEAGRDVAIGSPGELVARGANVMRGYWNNPQETREAFRDGMFRSGDIGYRDAEGYIYILDRLKDMIVTGGENVYSGEVEAVIYRHPAVREAAVFGVPDSQWGELVTACVVLKPGAMLTADELIQHCGKTLAHYKIPRRVEFSSTELPKSASGKIIKRALRERFWGHQQRAVS